MIRIRSAGLKEEQSAQQDANEEAQNAVQEAENAQACWKDMQADVQARTKTVTTQEQSKPGIRDSCDETVEPGRRTMFAFIGYYILANG